MADYRWLNQAPTMVGGISECMQKLDAWKHWEWDKSKPDNVNVSEIKELHLDFAISTALIISSLDNWRSLPHPPLLNRKRTSRQWAVLNVCIKVMMWAVNHEYTAYSLSRFGDSDEVTIGVEAMGRGVTLVQVVRLGLDQTMAGRVDSLDGVIHWTNSMMEVLKPLQDFDAKYAVRAGDLRALAGLGVSQ
jgi:hypothetical protein